MIGGQPWCEGIVGWKVECGMEEYAVWSILRRVGWVGVDKVAVVVVKEEE